MQGIITKRAGQEFEWMRQELGALYKRIIGRDAAAISDADVVEFYVRGQAAAVKALHALRESQIKPQT